jgi:hypothetical protein
MISNLHPRLLELINSSESEINKSSDPVERAKAMLSIFQKEYDSKETDVLEASRTFQKTVDFIKDHELTQHLSFAINFLETRIEENNAEGAIGKLKGFMAIT